MFGRHASALLSEPVSEGIDQGSGVGLAHREALLGRGAADLGLDGIELGDAAQSFGGNPPAASPPRCVAHSPARSSQCPQFTDHLRDALRSALALQALRETERFDRQAPAQ